MKKAIAIAIAKVRKKTGALQPDPHQSQSIEIHEEMSRAGLGVLLFAGAVVGIGGFFCLLNGMIRSGGVMDFVRGWLTALGGI